MKKPSFTRTALIALGGSLLVGLVLFAFVWPTKTIEIKNLPIAVTGPSELVKVFEDKFDSAAPGKFLFVPQANRKDSVDAIAGREVFGAIVLAGPMGDNEVLIASSANPMVAQQLGGMAQVIQGAMAAQIAQAGGDPSKLSVPVTDIAPLAEDDPTGAGLASAAFPLTLGGIVGGLFLSLLIQGRGKKVLFVSAFATLSGFVISWVMHDLFGFFQGDIWFTALVVAASTGATALIVGGLENVLGRPGLGLGSAFTMLIANPLASASLPWQFIAEPWGQFGQFLIPGASNWLLRTVSYFPEASQNQYWLTLVGWITAGLILILLPTKGEPNAEPESKPELKNA